MEMSKQAKKIRKLILEYLNEQREYHAPKDYDLSKHDGFNLGVSVMIELLEEVFNGVK